MDRPWRWAVPQERHYHVPLDQLLHHQQHVHCARRGRRTRAGPERLLVVDLKTVDERLPRPSNTSISRLSTWAHIVLVQADLSRLGYAVRLGRAISAAPARGAVAASLGGGVLLRKAWSDTLWKRTTRRALSLTHPSAAPSPRAPPMRTCRSYRRQPPCSTQRSWRVCGGVHAGGEANKALLREAMDLRGQLYAAIYEAVPRGKPAKKDEATPSPKSSSASDPHGRRQGSATTTNQRLTSILSERRCSGSRPCELPLGA